MALLDKFFNWKHNINYRGMTFHQRLVSQKVIEEARKYALLESRKMRQKLRDPSSDEYIIYIDPVHDLSDDEIRDFIAQSAMRDAVEEYIKANPKPVISQPQSDKLADVEQFEEDKEQRDAMYAELVQKHAEDVYNRVLNGLANVDREGLIDRYRRIQVDRVCEDVFTNEFEDYVLSASLYTDESFKKRAFTLEEFKELPSDARLFFRSSYNKIAMSYEELKNS